jgi:hypothetical protein
MHHADVNRQQKAVRIALNVKSIYNFNHRLIPQAFGYLVERGPSLYQVLDVCMMSPILLTAPSPW